MTDKVSSVNEDGDRFGIRFQRLGDFGGGSHVGVEIVVLEPGRQSYPSHYHLLEEEHLLVLEGKATRWSTKATLPAGT